MAANNKKQKAATGEYCVKRDGDRDIEFKGEILGRGHTESLLDSEDACIYRTNSGKFVAELTKGNPARSHSGVVAETAAEVAQFFIRQVEEGSGKNRVTRNELNEAGKLAMRDAAIKDSAFLEHSVEIVE